MKWSSVARRRAVLLVASSGLVALCAALGSSQAFAGSAKPNAPSGAKVIQQALSQSIVGASGTWAVLQMGQRGDPDNLFWQLFALKSGTAKWMLETPPGVADNGGLMIAADSQGSVLVGIGASNALTFSPLAETTDLGESWSPGVLPSALSISPAALAEHDDVHLAAVARPPRVLQAGANLTSWKSVVTLSELSRSAAGATCGIAALTSVAIAPDGTFVVGASCRRADSPGVMLDNEGGWHLADIPISGPLAQRSFAVIRLAANSSSVEALFSASDAPDSAVVAAWGDASARPWLVSPPLALASGARVIATGSGRGSQQFAVIASKGADRAYLVAPNVAWRGLPLLPAGSSTIAISPSGTTYALAVAITRLVVWRLGPTGKHWLREQNIVVPIEFGSSS